MPQQQPEKKEKQKKIINSDKSTIISNLSQQVVH